MQTFPRLYKKTSTDAIQTWEISVEPFNWDGTGNGATTWGKIVTLFGQQDGKIQSVMEHISEGKNIGKVNETTPYEQAVSEAQSRWELKKKKGYVETIEEAEAGKVDTTVIHGGIAPMLAHKFAEQSHKIKYPAFIQPKLDGHRCIAIISGGKASLWSRTQKKITSMVHIEAELEALYPDVDIILDGELYNHNYRDNFEALSSEIRQEKPRPEGKIVQFWVYDVVIDAPFSEREPILQELHERYNAQFPWGKNHVFVLPTFDLPSEDYVEGILQAMLKEGYEGAIVRNAAGVYKNKRSYDLQKVKVFQDAEFEVIGVKGGKGKMAGKAIFVCKTDEGDEFSAKMKGTLDSLTEYYDHPENWIGKQLTVQYQEMTSDGVPRFPVALRFREEI